MYAEYHIGCGQEGDMVIHCRILVLFCTQLFFFFFFLLTSENGDVTLHFESDETFCYPSRKVLWIWMEEEEGRMFLINLSRFYFSSSGAELKKKKKNQ